MSALFWAIGGLVFASFLLIVLRGAPFVPTHRRNLADLFSLYDFGSDDILVDLGSGDGRVLAAAADRGITAVGYELNPFLVILAKLRLRRYGAKAQTRLTDFWATQLPGKTAVVYVFLAGPFMNKLDAKLAREASRLGHDIVLVSYGMKLPGREPHAKKGGFLAYRYKA